MGGEEDGSHSAMHRDKGDLTCGMKADKEVPQKAMDGYEGP